MPAAMFIQPKPAARKRAPVTPLERAHLEYFSSDAALTDEEAKAAEAAREAKYATPEYQRSAQRRAELLWFEDWVRNKGWCHRGSQLLVILYECLQAVAEEVETGKMVIWRAAREEVEELEAEGAERPTELFQQHRARVEYVDLYRQRILDLTGFAYDGSREEVTEFLEQVVYCLSAWEEMKAGAMR